MTKEYDNSDTSHQGDDGATHAEWHPYRVWQATVRKSIEFHEPAAPTQDAPSAWDPFAVWKKQIKGN